MPYFFVPEITGFVHLHTFWEDFWQPKRSSNCEEKLWKLRIKVQPISKRGTLITEWKYLKLHLVVEPNLDLLTYSIWPWNLNHATLKRSGFSKIKTQNHCLGYPRKNPFKKEPLCRSLLGPSFCTDGFSHPWLCWNHCNLQHVSCHAGLWKSRTFYTEAGGGKSENSPRQWKTSKSYGNLPFFFREFPEKLHPTTRPCANTSWYWGKTDTHKHLDNQKHPHSQQLQVIPVIPILETVPQMFAGNRVNSSAFCCTLASIPLTYKYQVNAR